MQYLGGESCVLCPGTLQFRSVSQVSVTPSRSVKRREAATQDLALRDLVSAVFVSKIHRLFEATYCKFIILRHTILYKFSI